MKRWNFKTPRGTRDFLPDEMSRRKFVEKVIRQVFEKYGFQEIQTPIFEEFGLFAARSGEEIREGMFTFVSDSEEFAMRPELTAAVCRLITTGRLTIPKPYEIFYIGPCFRYERPQAGRYREFVQAGLELMGTSSPLSDAKVMAVAANVLNTVGIKNYELKVGNIGIFRSLLQAKKLSFDKQSRIISDIDNVMSMREKTTVILGNKKFDNDDTDFVMTKINELYTTQDRVNYTGEYEITPVKKMSDAVLKKWLTDLPKIMEETYKFVWKRDFKWDDEFITLLIDVSNVRGRVRDVKKKAESLLKGTAAEKPLAEMFDVLKWLELYGIKNYTVVLGVARGLDFYTGTVFEFDSPLLGAQKQVCGGGRYDKLVEEFGGPKTPATGFAFGFDRVVEALEKTKEIEINTKVDIYVATVTDNVLSESLEIVQKLRKRNLRVGENIINLPFRKQMEYANAIGASFLVIVGPKDLKVGKVTVKNMKTGKQKQVKINEVAKNLK